MDSDVLVVDDSAAIRKILQRVLRQTGMAIQTIHEAGDGQDALALMAQHRIDLVLSDINMPKMDGLQLLGATESLASVAQHTGGDDHHRGRRNESRRSCQARGRRIRTQAVYGRSNQGEARGPSGAGGNVMNLHKSIVESLIRSARDVFSTMLGTELTSGEVSVEASHFGTQRRRCLLHRHRRKLGRHRQLDAARPRWPAGSARRCS